MEGVDVRLKEGKAIVTFKPDNTVRFGDVVKVVRDKAFTPREARVSARGELLSVGGRFQLKVTGTNEIYDLAGAAAELQKHAGTSVLIDGVIPAPKDATYQKLMEVKSVRPVS